MGKGSVQWFTYNNLHFAAKGPCPLVMYSKGHHAQRHSLSQSINGNTRGTTLERQMSRAKGTGSFRKNDQGTAIRQQSAALVQRSGILTAVLIIIFARYSDSAEKQPSEETPAQLGGDEKNSAGNSLPINKAVHGSVPVQCDVQRWTGSGTPLRMKKSDALKINPGTQPVKNGIPKRFHPSCGLKLRAGLHPRRIRRSNGIIRSAATSWGRPSRRFNIIPTGCRTAKLPAPA